MVLPVIADTCRATIAGTCPSGARWSNTIHHRFTSGSPPGGADYDALAAKLVKLYKTTPYVSGAAILDFCKTTLTMDRITLTPLDGVTPSRVYAYAYNGVSVTASVPSEVSIVATLRTAQRGRRHRGRIFMPPFSVGNFDANGNFSTAPRDELQAQFVGYVADIVPVHWEVVVASYLERAALSITQVTIDVEPDVQRHRKQA